MRVLMLNYTLYGHANFFWFHRMGRELSRRGHQVVFLTQGREPGFRSRRHEEDGCEIIETPPGYLRSLHMSSYSLPDITTRLKELLARDYDALLVCDARPSSAIPFYTSGLVKPSSLRFIVACDKRIGCNLETFRGTRMAWTVPLETFWEQDLRRKSDGVILTSEQLSEETEMLGIPDERVEVLHQPANTRFPLIPREEARATLDLPKDKQLIALLTGAGGINPTLAALPIIREEITGTGLVYVGHKSTPDSRTERFAREHDLWDDLYFTGRISERRLHRWLCACDVGAIWLSPEEPNSEYRWPGKISDYTAAGLPIVANGIGETARFIQENGIGLLSESSVESFASKFCEVLRQPKLRESISQRSRSVAEDRLACDVQAERLERFIDRVREEGSHA